MSIIEHKNNRPGGCENNLVVAGRVKRNSKILHMWHRDVINAAMNGIINSGRQRRNNESAGAGAGGPTFGASVEMPAGAGARVYGVCRDIGLGEGKRKTKPVHY